MANPHPTPRLENLRQPWPSGTSGNPAGYSRGRRISDAMEGLIDELGLQREFATAAIAMALGQKHLLKQKVTDPETGEEVWVEQKPDLAWFQMIEQLIEPAARQRDADARLRAILDDHERQLAAQEEQDKAAESPERSQSASADKPFHVVSPSGTWVPAGEEKAESTGTLFQDVPAHAGSGHNSLATRHSPLATFQDMPAHGGSGQVALQAAQADLPAGDLGTTLAVERPSGQRSVPIPSVLLELINPARHAVRLQACVDAQLAGLFTGNIRGFAAGIIRVRPRLAGGLGRALAEIAVVACLLLFHQAVVVDNQRAGGHVVQAGAVAADEPGRVGRAEGEAHHAQAAALRWASPSARPTLPERLVPDQLARDLVAGEVVAGQAGPDPGTLVAGPTFPMLYPVLAPERPPDGKPAPTSKT